MKTCSKCETAKSSTAFSAFKRSPDGLRPWCKECSLAYDHTYRKTKRGHAAYLKYRRKWQRSDRGKYLAKIASAKYGQTTAGKFKSSQSSRRRRELKRGIEYKLSKQSIRLIYKRFGSQCFNCEARNQLEIDHHYPLAKGYGLVIDNAVLLCKSCNVSKSDQMPESFYTQGQLEKLLTLGVG